MTDARPNQQPKLLTTDLFGTYRPKPKGKKGRVLTTAPETPPVVDEALIRHALRSEPGPAPRPSREPYGVEALGQVTDAARLQANEVARQTALSGGDLTDAGRAALRAWSGEGGLGGSTNAFYTPMSLVETVWAVAQELGPVTRALEFSCGGGAFLSRAPKGTLLTAVELDETSARVAAALHPHAAVHHLPFEAYHRRSEDAPFDLVIGNPPFGVRGATAREDRPRITQAHWYFVLAGLERVAPGGLMAVVLPEGMFRNPTEREYREQVLDRAHVLTASAIPETAFRTTGAGVTTVLLVLRRHDAGVVEALAELTAEEQARLRDLRLNHDGGLKAFVEGTGIFHQEDGGAWKLGSTFGPLGTPSYKAVVRAGRFGEPVYGGPVAFSGDRLDAVVKQASARRHDILTRPGVEAAVRTLLGVEAEHRARAASIRAHPIREGALSECRTYRFKKGQWGYDSALGHPATLSALSVAQALTAARSAAKLGRANAASARQAALALHETHVGQFGAYDLAALTRASKVAPVLGVLSSAGGDVPAALAELPAFRPAITPGPVGEVAQQLEAYGILDEGSLSTSTGVPQGVALAHLRAEYAFTGRTWEANATYYRGRAYEKARVAESLADEFTGPRRDALLAQAARLRAEAPWVDLADMTLEARDTLMPEHVLTEWVNEYLGTRVVVKRHQWDQEGEPTNLIYAARDEHGVSLRMRNSLDDARSLAERQAVDASRVRLLEAYLNFRTPVDAVLGQDVKTPEKIAAERNANQQKAVRLERTLAAHFRSWLLASDLGGAVEATLNEHRYGLLSPAPDMRPLTVTDYKGPAAHPFQAGHVRTAAKLDGVIFDFGVGLGKTLTAFMLAALLRQSGRSRLPGVVVPLSRLGDWVMNAAVAVPDLRVLVIGGEPQRGPGGQILLDEDGEPRVREDTGEQRRQKVASLLTSPPDLVIFSFEAFEAMPMLEETRLRYVRGDSTLMSGVGAADTFDDRHRKLAGHRELVSAEKFMQRHLARVRVSTDTDVPFEATGIDALLLDEAHGMKNTYAAPAVYGDSSPKFLGGGGESNRALDANHKFRFVREKGGCTVALSATWFTNSPLEIFNMLSLVTDALPKYGIDNVSAFTARFCVIEPRLITLPDGGVEFRSCVVGFRNLDELRAIIGQHVIRETEDTCQMHDRIGMNLPPLHTVEHFFDLAPGVQAMYDAEQGKIEFAEDTGENHLFAIFSRLSKLTLHPPLMGVDAPNARFAACVEACMQARARGGRNVVFMYTGGDDGLAYRALRGMLVAAGYPEREIEVITASTHKTGGERLNVERRFRRGQLTCVIGSSVIEQGGNYQGATDLHHLDYPHHHMAFVQRIGRGRRQGTWVSEVHNHVYFARGSFDVIRYQNMLGKKGWAEQVYNSTITTCENTDLGFDGEEIAVMMSRDPEATRAAIRLKKEQRAQEGRQATLLADLAVIHDYLDTLALLDKRWKAAQGRENGPSPQDTAGINRLVTTLRGLHKGVGDLRAAGHPLTAVTRLQARVVWVEGLPLHAGMSFQVGGNKVRVAHVANTDTEVVVKNLDTGLAGTVPVADLAKASDVLPTTAEGAYGEEAFGKLPISLQGRIESGEPVDVVRPVSAAAPVVPVPADVLPEPVLTLTVGQAPPEPGTPPVAPPAPLRLRYGLSVTASARPVLGAQVFTIVNGALQAGVVEGEPLLIVEWRGERDVRQITLVVPDEAKRDHTRRLLRAQDPKLRARVDMLLRAAV